MLSVAGIAAVNGLLCGLVLLELRRVRRLRRTVERQTHELAAAIAEGRRAGRQLAASAREFADEAPAARPPDRITVH